MLLANPKSVTLVSYPWTYPNPLNTALLQVMVANIRCAEIASDQLSAFVMDQVRFAQQIASDKLPAFVKHNVGVNTEVAFIVLPDRKSVV